MIAIEQWSFRFILFILFAKGYSEIPRGNIDSKEWEVKEDADKSIFQLILDDDLYTTSRSLVSESDDYEQKETSTVGSKAVTKKTSIVASKARSRESSVLISNATSSAKRSLESENLIYDNEKTTVALKAANINRFLETESDKKYNEKENGTVGPTAVSTGNGSSATESEEFSFEHEHTTVGPTAVTTGDESLRAVPESREHEKEAEKEYDTAEHIDGYRRKPQNKRKEGPDFTAKGVIFVSTAAWTHRSFPATRKGVVTRAWSALMVDDYFLPYMGASKNSLSGDWVFFQKTAVEGPNLMPVVGSTHYYFPNWRTDGPPDTPHRYCTEFYKRYGPVCGYRMSQGGPDKWQYQYRSFENWCELEKENAGEFFNLFSILHRGKCTMTEAFFPNVWSSQDGVWISKSMKSIMSYADLADKHVLSING